MGQPEDEAEWDWLRSAPDDPGLREACGIFGVYAPGAPVAHYTYLGLFALQHRGQEAAGITVSDGEGLLTVKDTGLVASVFDDRKLAGLPGDLAIGHCRYSTTGASEWRNAQPVTRTSGNHEFALGHNGNLVNTAELAETLGMLPGTEGASNDSDLIAELVARELAGGAPDLATALSAILGELRGAFSLVVMDENQVVGVRDPNGFRPLCLGRIDEGWVLASEGPAIDVIGGTVIRELEPGEMLIIDGNGHRSLRPFEESRLDPSLCVFEFVYLARPDTHLYGHSVHQARVRMGEALAAQAPVEADMVMGVPESAVPAAEGFARASGIPPGQGLVRNRYIGRSFIAPTQDLRDRAVRMKYNPLVENVRGKRLVVVDDSIVRGTTQRVLVGMLREAGAAEVHLRITSPPIKWPCFYGIDTGDPRELLAADMDTEEIRRYLAADSLAYLSLDRLLAATGSVKTGYCDACFSGNYPVPVALGQAKSVRELPADDGPAPDGPAGEPHPTQPTGGVTRG